MGMLLGVPVFACIYALVNVIIDSKLKKQGLTNNTDYYLTLHGFDEEGNPIRTKRRISSGNDCLVCGTFFRRILIENGEDPDALKLSEKEETIWNFARAMAKDFHNIPAELYDELDSYYSEEQMIQLIAFAGQMYATNVFVTTAKVDLDEILINYRKG